MYYRMLTNHYAISLNTEIVNRYTKYKNDRSLTKNADFLITININILYKL